MKWLSDLLGFDVTKLSVKEVLENISKYWNKL